jgi:hypothetical protein
MEKPKNRYVELIDTEISSIVRTLACLTGSSSFTIRTRTRLNADLTCWTRIREVVEKAVMKAP